MTMTNQPAWRIAQRLDQGARIFCLHNGERVQVTGYRDSTLAPGASQMLTFTKSNGAESRLHHEARILADIEEG